MTLKLEWSYTINTLKLGAFKLMQVLNGLLLPTISWKHFPRVAVCKSNLPPKRLIASAEYWWGVSFRKSFGSEPTLVNADLHSTCKLKTRQFAIRRFVRRRWRTGDAYNWNITFLAQRLPTATCQVMGLGVGYGSGISQHYKLEQITNEVSNLYCFFFVLRTMIMKIRRKYGKASIILQPLLP